MPPSPSLNWQKLQDVYYSHSIAYESLNWTLENLYSNYRVALSPSGTLVALATKFVPQPSVIDVYSASGNKLWSVIYNSRPEDHIVDFGFRNEDLVVILSGKKIRYYKDFKGNFEEYDYTKDIIKLDDIGSLSEEDRIETPQRTSENKVVITNLENDETEEVVSVIEGKVWQDHCIIRLSTKFVLIDLDRFVSYEVPLNKLDSNGIHTFTLNQHEHGLSLLISYAKTIVSYTIGHSSFEYEDHSLTDGPFESIIPSPNGQLIALNNNQSSTVFVINKAFDNILLEYNTSNESSNPYQVAWCGNDAICLALRDEIKLIGPGQQSISFFYDILEEEDFDIDVILKDNDHGDDLSFIIPILLTQPDGLKVVTTNTLEFITRVSEPQRHLYQVGSSYPSSILLDCIDKLTLHSSKADTSISLLRADNTLESAINECLEAVLEEFSHFWQKKVLRAISFGKTYYEEYYNSDQYLRTVNLITVLNQVRSSELGIFLTYKELEEIGWEEFLKMLLRRDQHLLALKVIELLKISQYKDTVYIHWCCYKIKKELDMSDMELLKIIAKKLISYNGTDNGSSARNNHVSVSEISKVAYEEGRVNLCKLLINLEPSITKKISQYLKFDEVELALIKSFQTGDYDIAKLILLHLQSTLSVSQFFRVLNQNESKGLVTDESIQELKKVAVDIPNENLVINGDLIGHFWVESIGKLNSKLLETYYIQEDKKQELGISRLTTFLNKNKEASGDTYYADYKSRLLKSISRSGSRRYNRLYQRELDILELQKKLSETYMSNFYKEKSLNAVLTKLIIMNQIKAARTIVRDFKVSQENFWHLVLDNLTKLKEFDRLYTFALGTKQAPNTKSPIGFKPFVDAGFKSNAPPEHISDYIKQCVNLKYTERIDLFLKNDDVDSAASEAFKNKDISVLQDLANGLGNDDTRLRIVKGYITKLGY